MSDLVAKIVETFNKSLGLYISLDCLEECRDIYYLNARIFNDYDMYNYREIAATYFNVTDNLINNFNISWTACKFSLNSSKLMGIQNITHKLIASKLNLCNFSL